MKDETLFRHWAAFNLWFYYKDTQSIESALRMMKENVKGGEPERQEIAYWRKILKAIVARIDEMPEAIHKARA